MDTQPNKARSIQKELMLSLTDGCVICDMIKRNESDVENIDFELQALNDDKFLCFTLFLNFKKSSYLCNQMYD